MILQEAVEFLVRLGSYFKANEAEWQQAKQHASVQNAWFIPPFIEAAVEAIGEQYLDKHLIESFTRAYPISQPSQPIKVGLLMAGNIPLVGFHDFMCVLLSGHALQIKPSIADSILINHVVQKLWQWYPHTIQEVKIVEHLKTAQAVILTGNNNTARLFNYYFEHKPRIVRANKTSVAIITNTETELELNLLAHDMLSYFGRGCRNVTKLYVPLQYDLTPLLNVLKKFDYFMDFHKYKNNFDYQLSIRLLNKQSYFTNHSVLIYENESLFCPIATVHFEYYDSLEKLKASLNQNEFVQTIVGHGFTAFGHSQKPALVDFADGVDTMEWLCQL